MSKTYRFKRDKWLIKDNSILSAWDTLEKLKKYKDGDISNWSCYGMTHFYELRFRPDSEEGKMRLAKFHSDAKWHYWNHTGPGWFHNLFSQRPYRRDAKRQLQRYMLDDEFEVQLLRKPKREYWT